MSDAVHLNKIGSNFIDTFLNVFGSYSFSNELYGRIALHVIIGQALSTNVFYRMGSRVIDIRVHLLFIKPQGTGKGAGYGFVERVCKTIGLDFQNLTESTDAGLVGTLDRDDDGESFVVDGLLKTADIIGMEEASVLFDYTNEFSKRNMAYMQIAMNPLGDSSSTITKKLGKQLIEFKPHASFILLTYPPDKLLDKLLKTGFLDRIITVFEEVTLEDRLKVIRKMSEQINVSSKEEFEKNFNDVVNTLKAIIAKYHNSKITIKIPDDVHKVTLNIIEEFAMKILDASPKAREKLEHFISRLYETLLKLAIHHAILSGRETLDLSDIMYARMTYLPIWKNLIISIESLLIISDVERHRKYRIIRTAIDEYDRIMKVEKAPHVVKGGWVRRLTMITNLQVKWDQCSKETADNNLRKIEKFDPIEYEKFGKISEYEKDKFFEKKNIGGFDYVRKIREIST